MSPEVIAILSLVAVPAIVWAWEKFVKPLWDKTPLAQKITAALADGELTKEEVQAIIDEATKLLKKKEAE